MRVSKIQILCWLCKFSTVLCLLCCLLCQVSIGNDHVIVVTTERIVYSWGNGSKGQLGHGNLESKMKPSLVETLKGKSIIK
jgi:alpha-tubulin suppressor-like RCC1 family protein